MAAAFHVFVEGATDTSPAGIGRLAEAIGNHYGLPGADILARLQKGRFRVKSNTDRETADLYLRDLQRLGAVCVVEEATPDNSQRSTPLPFPAQRPATPPAGTPAARPSGSILPPQPRPSTPPPVGGFTSGLSAAFSGQQSAASLGALEGSDIPLSLASVDGSDEQGRANEAAFEPPAGGLPASIGPAPQTKKPAEKPAKPKDEPLDLFAPPDAQGEEFRVDIAADEQPVARASQPSMQVPNATATPARGMPVAKPSVEGGVAAPSSSKLGPLGSERVRLVAGVVLAIVLGFVPAHFVAAMREQSTYEEIDRKVIRAQQQADTPETYALLDQMRADQLDRKEAERRNAAIIALVIWGAVGGALAFAWFKKIPWDSFE